MKKFRISVNGVKYDVEVEEIGGTPSGLHPSPASSPVSSGSPMVAPGAGSGSGDVKAPMPGVILDVRVKVGDAVNVGDVTVILEAMKMENEVVAEKGGVVKEIKVEKGQSVGAGDVLVVVE
jgi:biotin carboxyl carrier protein